MQFAHLEMENALRERGFSTIAGMDEVGRGSLAGPVSVGVAVISTDVMEPIVGLIDSKAITAKKREALLPMIRNWASTAIGSASAEEIDVLGMTRSLRLAGQRALAQVAATGVIPDALLLDGKHNWLRPAESDLFSEVDESERLYSKLLSATWKGAEPWDGLTQTVVKGDFTCATIAAASVLAKVERDALMTELDKQYPGYGWAKNKGYGSVAHQEAISRLGPSALHRLSWKLPVNDEQLRVAVMQRALKEQI